MPTIVAWEPHLRSLLSARKIRGGFRHFASLGALTLLAAPAAPEEPPVTLALVIDISGSLRRTDLARARELALGTLAALPAGSQAAVYSFADQSHLVQARTADPEAVRRAVDSLQTSGRFTALHDALYDASRYLRDAPGSRRAILLVTDGRDERSAVNLEDGLAVALSSKIPVFCVGVGRVEEAVLRRIAKLTDGQYQAGDVDPAAIAAHILETPVVASGAAPPSEGRPTAAPSAAPSPPRAPAALPPAQSPAVSPLVWAVAGVIALVLAGVLALRATARRRSADPSPLAQAGPSLLDTGQAPAERGTVFARLDLSKERLEKTLLLREKPVLAVTTGPRAGQVFPLSRGSAISIGRARANDIVLDDAAVSTQHCRIRLEDDRFVVHDLGSTNGTRVNDRRITRQVLAVGDVIQIGETRLEFRSESSAAERL